MIINKLQLYLSKRSLICLGRRECASRTTSNVLYSLPPDSSSRCVCFLCRNPKVQLYWIDSSNNLPSVYFPSRHWLIFTATFSCYCGDLSSCIERGTKKIHVVMVIGGGCCGKMAAKRKFMGAQRLSKGEGWRGSEEDLSQKKMCGCT